MQKDIDSYRSAEAQRQDLYMKENQSTMNSMRGAEVRESPAGLQCRLVIRPHTLARAALESGHFVGSATFVFANPSYFENIALLSAGERMPSRLRSQQRRRW